jgi:hypothetical protein
MRVILAGRVETPSEDRPDADAVLKEPGMALRA